MPLWQDISIPKPWPIWPLLRNKQVVPEVTIVSCSALLSCSWSSSEQNTLESGKAAVWNRSWSEQPGPGGVPVPALSQLELQPSPWQLQKWSFWSRKIEMEIFIISNMQYKKLLSHVVVLAAIVSFVRLFRAASLEDWRTPSCVWRKGQLFDKSCLQGFWKIGM